MTSTRLRPPSPLQASRTAGTVPRLALSPDEAAAALGVSRDYLDLHVLPELRVVRRGRRRLVPVRELERWLTAEAALAVGEEAARAVIFTVERHEVAAKRHVRARRAPLRRWTSGPMGPMIESTH